MIFNILSVNKNLIFSFKIINIVLKKRRKNKEITVKTN